MVEISKEQIFNLLVMNGCSHNKICTDHVDIIEYLLNFSGHGNLL